MFELILEVTLCLSGISFSISHNLYLRCGIPSLTPLILITRLTGFLWGQMKPFIRGKILFSPDTPATRRIMGAVNATFSPIEGVRRYDVTNEMTT